MFALSGATIKEESVPCVSVCLKMPASGTCYR
jgi:hypothetical protein